MALDLSRTIATDDATLQAVIDHVTGDRLPQKGPARIRTGAEPRPEPVAYRRQQHGLLGWLRDAAEGWPGPAEAEGTPAEREVLTEKVRSGPQGVVLPWFAPYLDNQTGETAQMRLAYRAMMADPNVKAAVLGKVLAVGALDLQIIPAGKKKGKKHVEPGHQEVADFVAWGLTERLQGGFPDLAWNILSGGLLDGYSVNEKVWQHEDRDQYAGNYILSALKPKDVGNDVVLQTDEYKNVVGVQALRYNGGEVYSPSNFVIFQHLPLFGSPVGMSDLRAAYSRWWMLDTVLKLRAVGLEKRAWPVLMGEYETTSQRPALERALADARMQTWFSVPKGVRVEALNIAGAGDEMFASAIADLKEDIFLAIQGATLQALTGQEGAIRGNSNVHKSTSDLFRWYLARCLEVLLNDRDAGLIRDMVDLNYVVSRYPRAVLGAIDTGDLLEESQLDKNLLDMGLTLSKAAMYEKYSRVPPDPDDPDDALTSPSGDGAGGAGGGLPGMGGEPPPGPGTPDEGGDEDMGNLLSGLKFAEMWEEFLEEKKDKRGRRYCVEKGKGIVKCPEKPEPTTSTPAGGARPAGQNATGAGGTGTAGKGKEKVAPAEKRTAAQGKAGEPHEQLKAEGHTPEKVAAILGQHSYATLQALAKHVGEKANGATKALAERIVQAFTRQQGGGKPPEDKKPPEKVPDKAPDRKPPEKTPEKKPTTKQEQDAAALKKLEGMGLKDGQYNLKGDPEGRQAVVRNGKASFVSPPKEKPEPQPDPAAAAGEKLKTAKTLEQAVQMLEGVPDDNLLQLLRRHDPAITDNAAEEYRSYGNEWLVNQTVAALVGHLPSQEDVDREERRQRQAAKLKADMDGDHESKAHVKALAGLARFGQEADAYLGKHYSAMEAATTTLHTASPDSEEFNRALAEHQRLNALTPKVEAAVRQHRGRVAEETRKILAAGQPSSLQINHDASVSPEVRGRVDAGASWLASITHGLSEDVGSKQTAGRAHYNPNDGTINMDPGSGVGVIVHEICHRIEKLPGIKEALQRFLERRCGDEPYQKMNKVFPGGNFDDHEEGRKDDFEKTFGPHAAWYVGKTYEDGSSELLSMAVQKLYEDPHGLATNDPELCQFVVGLLHGRIRGA